MSQIDIRWLGYISLAVFLRLVLLMYGIWQDSNTSLKYSDVDYFVFTDAARYVAAGQSPYDRETYRYTPILAWILWPTTLSSISFSFGKLIFCIGDIVAGCLIIDILKNFKNMSNSKALNFASIWLLNPMVSVISTRGSSEGLLAALVVTLLWAVLRRRVVLAGILLGLSVHFKIYPFIYGTSILWWLDDQHISDSSTTTSSCNDVIDDSIANKRNFLCEKKRESFGIWNFFNSARLTLVTVSLLVFVSLNILMYSIYGTPFLQESYFYHLTRSDHRHNFSPYNILLYLHSSSQPIDTFHTNLVKLAFIPQLFLSTFAIPLVLAKKDLAITMFAQTFAFVTFNKVCTSQYFIWYLVFLPLYLPNSSLTSRKSLGILVITLWVIGQAVWLHQAFQLEFVGRSTFIPGLWNSSLFFFFINTWILGMIVEDVGLRQELLVLKGNEILTSRST